MLVIRRYFCVFILPYIVAMESVIEGSCFIDLMTDVKVNESPSYLPNLVHQGYIVWLMLQLFMLHM